MTAEEKVSPQPQRWRIPAETAIHHCSWDRWANPWQKLSRNETLWEMFMIVYEVHKKLVTLRSFAILPLKGGEGQNGKAWYTLESLPSMFWILSLKWKNKITLSRQTRVGPGILESASPHKSNLWPSIFVIVLPGESEQSNLRQQHWEKSIDSLSKIWLKHGK